MNQNRKRLILTGSIYMLMLGYAVSSTVVGPLMKEYIGKFNISLAEGGLITAFQGLGGILAVLAGIFIIDKVRKSTVIILTFSVYCVSVLAVSVVGSYAALVALFFMIGASTKMLDAALNANISDINHHKRRFYVSLLHASFGVGALIGPLFSAALINHHVASETVFLYLGIICALFLLGYAIALKSRGREVKPERQQHKVNPIVFVKDRRILLLCICAFLYTGFSVGISTWMPIYMQNELSCGVFVSGLPVMFLWAGIIAGRVSGTFLAQKIGAFKLLYTCNLCCSAVWAFAVILNNPYVIMVAAGICGFCVGGTIPMSVATVCDWHPKNTGTATSVLFLFATVGYMLLPWVTGVLMDSVNYKFGIGTLCLMPLISSIGFFRVKIRNEQTI